MYLIQEFKSANSLIDYTNNISSQSLLSHRMRSVWSYSSRPNSYKRNPSPSINASLFFLKFLSQFLSFFSLQKPFYFLSIPSILGCITSKQWLSNTHFLSGSHSVSTRNCRFLSLKFSTLLFLPHSLSSFGPARTEKKFLLLWFLVRNNKSGKRETQSLSLSSLGSALQ
jgi:hypothetical protein